MYPINISKVQDPQARIVLSLMAEEIKYLKERADPVRVYLDCPRGGEVCYCRKECAFSNK